MAKEKKTHAKSKLSKADKMHEKKESKGHEKMEKKQMAAMKGKKVAKKSKFKKK